MDDTQGDFRQRGRQAARAFNINFNVTQPAFPAGPADSRGTFDFEVGTFVEEGGFVLDTDAHLHVTGRVTAVDRHEQTIGAAFIVTTMERVSRG